MESNSLREGLGGQQPQAIASERNRPMLPCRHHVLARAAKMRRPAIAGIAGESARSCLGNNSCAGTTQSCHRPAAAVPPKLPAAAAAPPPAPAALVAGIMLSFDNHDFCATEVTRLNQWPQLERLLEMPNPAQESSVPRQAREVEPEWLKQCARVYPGTGKSDARGRSAGKIRACSPRSQPSSELPIYSRHNPHSIPEATHPAGATRARRYQIPLVH